MSNLTVLGVKHGTFTDDKGKSVPFHQLALDCGNYLKVFKVKEPQAKLLDNLAPGTVLSNNDGMTVKEYFIFL